jgi:GT2 family glycosyltransferase
MKVRSIAVLMTCHNRRDLTVACLKRLLDQPVVEEIDVFVTDDGSTDGTAEVLRRLDGRVHVIAGTGDLYWASGMALAEDQAVATEPDFLLWLNDDTLLDPNALNELVGLSARFPDSIIVGATRDPVNSTITYGARLRTSSWHPQRFELLPIGRDVQRGDTFNGNLVLIPAHVHRCVGRIDAAFPHAYADDDYGLRATALGIDILQAPGTVAVCARNPPVARPSRGLAAWKAMQDPKGLPWRSQIRYLHRHAGRYWPWIFAAQQLKTLLGLGPSGGSRT